MALITAAAVLGGGSLVSIAVLDVLLTLAHLDVDGWVAGGVQRRTWMAAVWAADRRPRHRRRILAAAGPVMLVATIVAWAALFFGGFALIVWPAMPHGLAEALYFSGSVGSTVGVGDLVPTGWLQAAVVLEALLGLALLTGVVTFVLNTIAAVVERNVGTLLIHEETGCGRDGVGFVGRTWAGLGEAALVRRLERITDCLRSLYVRAHHYPIVHSYYRSHEEVFDPEPAFRTALEAAIAAHVLARAEGAAALGAAADALDHILTRHMKLMARDYMDYHLADELEAPTPGERDRERVGAIARRLGVAAPCEEAVTLAHQGRRFLDALDGETYWRRDHAKARQAGALP